jgi:iron complex transport system substrate-binding protein
MVLSAALVRAETLTDSDNRCVTFERPFSRIISLYTAHTENLHALGLTTQVIAVSRGIDLYPGVPRLSFRDDPERFIALRPDLVLIRPMLSRAHPQMLRRLEENGITVISLQPVSVDGMLHYWQELGRITGRTKQAAGMIAQFSREVRLFRERISKIPFSRRKKVYFESIHSKMKTFAPSSMAIFCLETAGGINIAADAQRVRSTNIAYYGRERILSKADEIDVYLAQKGRMNPVTVEEIENTPGFEVIKAVQERRVYLIEEGLVSRPVPGLIKGIQKIYAMLYGPTGEAHAR